MKRIAILSTSEPTVGLEIARILNEGSQYRVGLVPRSLAAADFQTLSAALSKENVDILLLENFDRQLPEDFPFEVLAIMPGESVEEVTARLNEACQAERPTVTPPPPPPHREPESGYEAPADTGAVNPGQPAVGQLREPMPPTYLIWSIVATLLCCFIPGIVAIVFSSMVTSRYLSGNIERARRASRMAEIWIIVSIVAGVISNTLYFPFMLGIG